MGCLVVGAVSLFPFCAVGGRRPVFGRRAAVARQRDHGCQGRRRRGDHSHQAGIDLSAVGRGEGDLACVERVAPPGGVCRRSFWVRGRLLGVRLVLSAGGGLALAAAEASPATVTI